MSLSFDLAVLAQACEGRGDPGCILRLLQMRLDAASDRARALEGAVARLSSQAEQVIGAAAETVQHLRVINGGREQR
jgi:hypothetical protein